MKLLLAAAFAFTAYSQQLVSQTTNNGEVPAPINIIEEVIPEVEIKKQETKTEEIKNTGSIDFIKIPNEMIVGKEEFNPTVFDPTKDAPQKVEIQQNTITNQQTKQIAHNHDGQPMPGQQQFYPQVQPVPPMPFPMPFPMPGPMPGQQEFNPTEFIPGQDEQQRRKKHKDRKDHKNKEFRHEDRENKHGGKMEKRMRKQQKRREEMARLQNPLDYDAWENHVERGHLKGKFHRKLWIPLFFVALFFTIVGVLLAKCVRKIRKNKCKRNRQNCPNMTLAELQNEIKSKEMNLNKLRADYQSRKAEQDSQAEMRRQEHLVYPPHQMQMIQRIQPQQLRGYPHPHPLYTYQNQIPIGRPM